MSGYACAFLDLISCVLQDSTWTQKLFRESGGYFCLSKLLSFYFKEKSIDVKKLVVSPCEDSTMLLSLTLEDAVIETDLIISKIFSTLVSCFKGGDSLLPTIKNQLMESLESWITPIALQRRSSLLKVMSMWMGIVYADAAVMELMENVLEEHEPLMGNMKTDNMIALLAAMGRLEIAHPEGLATIMRLLSQISLRHHSTAASFLEIAQYTGRLNFMLASTRVKFKVAMNDGGVLGVIFEWMV